MVTTSVLEGGRQPPNEILAAGERGLKNVSLKEHAAWWILDFGH